MAGPRIARLRLIKHANREPGGLEAK
jgi:hypothetical protein